MYHVLVWVAPEDLPLIARLNLLPFQNTPVGPLLYKSTAPDDPGWLIDPSKELGMQWEDIYAKSNRKPHSLNLPRGLRPLARRCNRVF